MCDFFVCLVNEWAKQVRQFGKEKNIQSSEKVVSQLSLVISNCSFPKTVCNLRIAKPYFVPCAHKRELGAFVVEDRHLVLCGGNISIWGVVIINGSTVAFRTQSNIQDGAFYWILLIIFRKKLHLRCSEYTFESFNGIFGRTAIFCSSKLGLSPRRRIVKEHVWGGIEVSKRI